MIVIIIIIVMIIISIIIVVIQSVSQSLIILQNDHDIELIKLKLFFTCIVFIHIFITILLY